MRVGGLLHDRFMCKGLPQVAMHVAGEAGPARWGRRRATCARRSCACAPALARALSIPRRQYDSTLSPPGFDPCTHVHCSAIVLLSLLLNHGRTAYDKKRMNAIRYFRGHEGHRPHGGRVAGGDAHGR